MSQNKMIPRSYYWLLLASTLLMASAFVVSKLFIVDGIHPLVLVASRFTLAGALAIFWLSLRRQLETPKTLSDVGGVFLVGTLQTAVLFGTGFIAMEHLSAATISLLTLTMPIWVTGMLALMNRKFPPLLQLIALGVGMAGVALIIGSGVSQAGMGELQWFALALVGAACWASATVFTKTSGLSITGWSLNAWQMLVGGGEVLILALAMDLPGFKLVLVSDILLFIWLVVPASILSFGFWFSALKLGGAAVTSGYLFLIPLFTALISVPVLNASFAPMQLLGGVAVGAAVWLMSRSPT
ncbi:MAG: DMT family transporter [Luminiphilus sp.]|jgi:drug/metabolite transporter (DMT)-like permease|nr:DMT family transporter [Halieaceae bacterium]MDG1829765.1 DMT family transporter [Luminiphilus sp.]